MNRPAGWLIASCLLILSGLFLFNPGPIPHLKQSYARAGAESLADKQFYRAISFYERVLSYDPIQPEVNERIGIAYSETIQTDTALKWLADLEIQDLLSDEGKVRLGTLYLAKNQPQKAEKLWAQVPAGSALFLEAQTYLTDLYIKQARWSDSIRQLEKLNRFTGETRYHQLAMYHRIFLDPVEASHHLEANPGEYPPDLAKILPIFTKQNADSPSSRAIAWIQVGDFFQIQGEGLLATKAYQQAQLAYPESGIPYGKLANQNELAVEIIKKYTDKAIELEPDNAQVNELVGYAWLKSNKPELALLYLIKANQLQPGNRNILSALARTELDLGNLEEALRFLEQSAQVTPGDPAGWVEIARFCLDHNFQLRDHGLAASRKAILADEKNVIALDMAGQIYWELGDVLTAQQFFLRALDQDPEYEPARLHYGISLIESGDLLNARILIESVIQNSTDLALRQQAIQVLSEIGQ